MRLDVYFSQKFNDAVLQHLTNDLHMPPTIATRRAMGLRCPASIMSASAVAWILPWSESPLSASPWLGSLFSLLSADLSSPSPSSSSFSADSVVFPFSSPVPIAKALALTTFLLAAVLWEQLRWTNAFRASSSASTEAFSPLYELK